MNMTQSGSKKVVFEKYPDVPGWEWEVGKDWEVDHSKSFGDTDEEGKHDDAYDVANCRVYCVTVMLLFFWQDGATIQALKKYLRP